MQQQQPPLIYIQPGVIVWGAFARVKGNEEMKRTNDIHAIVRVPVSFLGVQHARESAARDSRLHLNENIGQKHPATPQSQCIHPSIKFSMLARCQHNPIVHKRPAKHTPRHCRGMDGCGGGFLLSGEANGQVKPTVCTNATTIRTPTSHVSLIWRLLSYIHYRTCMYKSLHLYTRPNPQNFSNIHRNLHANHTGRRRPSDRVIVTMADRQTD